MSKATYSIELPASIKAAAARLAKEDGVSLNQWIAAAVAQKIGVVETAAALFGSGLSVRNRMTWNGSCRRCRTHRSSRRT